MKLNDAVWGALLALLGARGPRRTSRAFPRIPGQNVGPALFPGHHRRRPRASAAHPARRAACARGAQRRRALVELADWLRSPRHVLGASSVLVGVNVFYLLAVDRLGFLLTAFVYLAALLCGAARALGAASCRSRSSSTLVIHYAFYKLLRVPLPWGVLQGVAW